MQNIQRLMVNIFSNDLSQSKKFYSSLFNFDTAFDSDWFVQLISSDKSHELGLLLRTHETIPEGYQHSPQGSMLTFVVEDSDKTYELAQGLGYTIVQPPTDTPYGQRRLLLQDPDGTLVDVSSLIPDFQFN